MNLNTFNAMYILYKVQPSTLSRSQLYAYQCQLLSPHALSAQCTPSMFCSFDEHCANVSIMSVAAKLSMTSRSLASIVRDENQSSFIVLRKRFFIIFTLLMTRSALQLVTAIVTRIFRRHNKFG